ncbi:macrolide export protein MacA [mine drainage metagenome]|uniref:Macrolide export protein MacA n=1 Tax=mine drainage metagenome TaxID=410659 RepID=A0A1J5QW35_9ZZZZ
MSTPPDLSGSARRREGARRRRVRADGFARTRWLAALATLALLGVAVAGWWVTHRSVPVSYITAPVTRGIVARTVTATGTVNPVLTVIVGSYVSGVIQSQYCDYNTKVKKGQLCAKIDPRPYQTIVDENAAQLGTARAQLVKDQANFDYARNNYTRQSGLLGRGAVSQDTADQARNALDQAAAQVQLDKASVQERKASLEAARVNLDYTNIVSPVDGTVVSRNITIGQTVAASFQTPTLFLIATDLTRMQVDANVSESDIGAVRDGDKASFTVEAYSGHPFQGRVVQVRQAPQSVQNVVTYDVVVGVDNKALLLKPGMTATVGIVTAERDGVLRVPDQALRFSPAGAAARAEGRQTRVWVLRDGRPAPATIKTGLDDDTYTEVVAGEIKAGDRVIVGENRAGAAAQAGASMRFGL